ncbi:hypothetical protein ZWY2020_050649 [Hordeum vulgare]|nr:hypothetical protein ZWY2020_050649 [Hordeum vulgare]
MLLGALQSPPQGRVWKKFMKKARGEWEEELQFRQLNAESNSHLAINFGWHTGPVHFIAWVHACSLPVSEAYAHPSRSNPGQQLVGGKNEAIGWPTWVGLCFM